VANRHSTLWLDTLFTGLVLHTGPASFTLGDRITAAPISSLWA